MKECEQIALLLGPFEDGELEPHEMQEVARHLATCKSCEELLADYGAIGREMRNIISVPPLTGFAEGVMARIAEHRVPLRQRIAEFFDGMNQRWAAAFAMVSMAGAVAVLTALLLTPYLRHNLNQNPTIAKATAPAAPTFASATTDQEGGHILTPSTQEPEQQTATSDITPDDSHAIINRLESQIPTTAVWSEPKGGTTVIWLPSEQ